MQGQEAQGARERLAAMAAASGRALAPAGNRGSPGQAGVQGARREVIVGNRRMFAGGDIITAIDEQPLRAWKDLDAYLEAKTEVGQGITLHLLREGQAQTITIELAEEPPHLS